MKFFEIYDPYYALIKAHDQDEAIKVYTEYVADDAEDTLKEEIREVDRDYALVLSGRSITEDKKRLSIKEILADFNDEEPQVMLIDSALL